MRREEGGRVSSRLIFLWKVVYTDRQMDGLPVLVAFQKKLSNDSEPLVTTSAHHEEHVNWPAAPSQPANQITSLAVSERPNHTQNLCVALVIRRDVEIASGTPPCRSQVFRMFHLTFKGLIRESKRGIILLMFPDREVDFIYFFVKCELSINVFLFFQ